MVNKIMSLTASDLESSVKIKKDKTQIKRWIKSLSVVTSSTVKQMRSLEREGNEGAACFRTRTSLRHVTFKQRSNGKGEALLPER